MRTIAKQYITDNKGNKISVVVPIKEYKKMLENLEEIEDIKLYDIVKAKNEPSIPISQYIARRRKR